MDENELKATMGETAFNGMSAEQKSALMAKITKTTTPPPAPNNQNPPPAQTPGANGGENDDLRDKANKEKLKIEKENSDIAVMEKAIGFVHLLPDFLKQNKDILPSSFEGIVSASDRENYATKIEKSNAVKSSFVQEFFAIQSNVDLLTPAQKVTLDDYLKLTKNEKEKKSQVIFENLFEPTLELIKRVKKAEELGKARSGLASDDATQSAYKDRLMSASKAVHLGQKKGA